MKMKKIIALALAVGILGAVSITYAAMAKTPAEIATELTGISAQELQVQRQQGKTYGEIARQAGVSEAFKEQMMTEKKAILDKRVADGKLTQAQADEIVSRMTENQLRCDGTGSARIGKQSGAGFGCGDRAGQGMGGNKGENGCTKGQGKGIGCRGVNQ